MVEELKVEGKNSLFTIFPIGTTMQDGSKRKKSNEICKAWTLAFLFNFLFLFSFIFFILGFRVRVIS